VARAVAGRVAKVVRVAEPALPPKVQLGARGPVVVVEVEAVVVLEVILLASRGLVPQDQASPAPWYRQINRVHIWASLPGQREPRELAGSAVAQLVQPELQVQLAPRTRSSSSIETAVALVWAS
jgi:hypothetical protein